MVGLRQHDNLGSELTAAAINCACQSAAKSWRSGIPCGPDDVLAVPHQVDQQVEHLRLDGNGLGTPAQLAPVGIERMTGKQKLHVGSPKPDREAVLKE